MLSSRVQEEEKVLRYSRLLTAHSASARKEERKRRKMKRETSTQAKRKERNKIKQEQAANGVKKSHQFERGVTKNCKKDKETAMSHKE